MAKTLKSKSNVYIEFKKNVIELGVPSTLDQYLMSVWKYFTAANNRALACECHRFG